MQSGQTVFPDIAPEIRRAKLTFPAGKIRAILDTDTFNEIDDQFALVMMMLSPEKFDVRAITAAPFFNKRSSGPADGMEKSYDEICRLLKFLKHPAENFAFRGSNGYLPDRDHFVESPAARRIVELAHEAHEEGENLYVIAIGAITNVASALLMDPAIAAMITIVWLGGHPVHYVHNREFNLIQDVPASQVIFDSGVPLIQVPCIGVAELLHTGRYELAARCTPAGPLGKFLTDRTIDMLDSYGGDTRSIWDISVIAYFLCPDAFLCENCPTPTLADDGSWLAATQGRPEMVVVRHISRDPVFNELFRKLKTAPQ